MDFIDFFQQREISKLRTELSDLKFDTKLEAQDAALKMMDKLESKLDMHNLINRAMWEILEEKLGVTREELNEKVKEIDLRDGKADGKLTLLAEDCPQCDAKVNRDYNRCFFCGYEPPSVDSFDSISF